MSRYCLFFLLLIQSTILSCSINRLAVNASSGLLVEASKEAEAESNIETFKNGVSANLMLMEGLLSQSPDNENILLALTKGYAGLAFAVNETDMLMEEWSESNSEKARTQAMFNYTRAFNFGLRYLKKKKIELKDLISVMNEPQGIQHLLDKKLPVEKKDLELILFTAQSYAALINLQKDNMSIIAELPVAKAMFDWVCMKNPSINYGTCDIFYGAFEAGRPKMLGGNPEKGKEIFLRAIDKHPHNWLIRASFMQYYLIPQGDKDGFLLQLEYLKEKLAEFNNYHIYRADSQNKNVGWNVEHYLRLYQALALKRLDIMDSYQKKFFE